MTNSCGVWLGSSCSGKWQVRRYPAQGRAPHSRSSISAVPNRPMRTAYRLICTRAKFWESPAFWRTSRPGRRSWMSTIRPARTQLSSIGVQRGALSVDVETFGARNENPLWTLVIIATGASCKQCDGDGQVLRGDLHGYDHTSHHSTRSSTARRRLVRPRTLVLSRANTPGA